MVYCKPDSVLKSGALLRFPKDSVESYGLDSFYSVSLSGYLYECDVYECEQVMEYFCDKNLYLLCGKSLRGGLSGVQGPKHFLSDGKKVLPHDDVINLFGSLSIKNFSIRRKYFRCEHISENSTYNIR